MWVKLGISTSPVVSTGANVAARAEIAGRTIVTFAPSSTERYFSSDLFLDIARGVVRRQAIVDRPSPVEYFRA